MLPLTVEYNVYNRPVSFDGVVYPCVGIINVSDKLDFRSDEDVETTFFGQNEDEVINKAEDELRDMLPERYKNIDLSLIPICTESNKGFKPIPYEIFIKNPDHYYLTDCADEL